MNVWTVVFVSGLGDPETAASSTAGACYLWKGSDGRHHLVAECQNNICKVFFLSLYSGLKSIVCKSSFDKVARLLRIG